jgi:hypothetical protein
MWGIEVTGGYYFIELISIEVNSQGSVYVFDMGAKKKFLPYLLLNN